MNVQARSTSHSRKSRNQAHRRAAPSVPSLVVAVAAVAAFSLVSAEVSLASFGNSENLPGNTFSLDVLGAPTGLGVDAVAPEQLDLDWSASSSVYAAGYNIYRAEEGMAFAYLDSVTGQATTSYSDSAVEAPETSSYVAHESTIVSSNVTNITVNVPASTTSGDLLLAHVSTNGGDPTFDAVTGLTLLDAGGSNVGTAVFYRVADGTEPASYTFTWSSGEEVGAVIMTYRGIDPAAPIDAWSTSSGNSSSPIAPSVVADEDESVVVRLLSANKDKTITQPAGHDGRFTVQSTGGKNGVGGAGADVVQPSAGATGTAAFTLSGSTDWATYTIALKPDPNLSTGEYSYYVETFYENWTSAASATVVGNTSSTPVSTSASVTSSSDDAEEYVSDNSMYLDSSDIELGLEDLDGGRPQVVGLRFDSLQIPNGATIVDAWIQFTVDETDSSTANLTFQAEAIDDAPTFSNSDGDISSRSTTVASVAWAPNAWTIVGEAGTDQRTPDLSAIIEEVVARPGWVSGNAVAVIITGTGTRVAESYDEDPGAVAQLFVEYSP